MAFNISYIYQAIDKFSPITRKIDRSVRKNVRSFDSLDRKINKTSNNFTRKVKAMRNSTLDFGGIIGGFSAIEFTRQLVDAQVTMEGTIAGMGIVLERFNTGLSNTDAARRELGFLRDTANELGVSFEESLNPYQRFLAASRLPLEQTRESFTGFAKAARIFGLSGNEFGGVVRALEQMQSKGRVMSEELKLQLGDRMPGVLKLFADAAGLSTSDFIKAMEAGRVSSDIMLKVSRQIEEQFGGGFQKASESLGAEIQRLQNAFFQLKVEMSTGLFGDTIKAGARLLTKNMDKVATALKVLALLLIPIGVKLLVVGILSAASAFLGLISPLITAVGWMVRGSMAAFAFASRIGLFAIAKTAGRWIASLLLTVQGLVGGLSLLLGLGIVNFFTNLALESETFANIIVAIDETVTKLINNFKLLAGAAGKFFSAVGGRLGTGLSVGFERTKEQISGGFGAIGGFLSDTASSAANAVGLGQPVSAQRQLVTVDGGIDVNVNAPRGAVRSVESSAGGDVDMNVGQNMVLGR